MVDDFLSEDERIIRKKVRNFVETDLLPVINDYWDRAEFPFALVPKIAALGIVGTTIEGYGCPGMSRLAAGMVAMEMARGDGSINTFIGVQSGLAMGTINTLGSEEQKQRWLPGMARLEKIGAFGLTEPDHGSDSVGLETSARRDGDHYILNGRKRWIGNASFADVVVLWARDEADGKVKAFILEKNGDGSYPAGYRAEVITGKIGKRAILQPDITIENLRIPAENKLAEANSFRDVTRVLTATRGGASWESVGHGIAAYEAAVKYAKERVQFGKPIASYQLVQNKLANMLAELTAMQLICFRLAALADQGKMTGPMASLAKMHTAQKARWICQEARDILGGNGLLLENHVARHMTDMEVVHTYEGTDSIQSLLIGRDITGISAFSG
ncbi:acyl-CoA dehydrogenase family protein [Pseudarthrobacter sp. GA104]|uniref:acyl-CoA dehydrogenase family protein n=1 Tax=Micrococcaceae TaxID=1268 RepID=UPI0012F8107B|nr:acyl-CoA dehydrogenase family protein [Pseudarthrobacter sp. GA104]MDT0194334.1 acyl-CoA dehydrogenase family protein [Arthrobacter sp. AB6]MUU72028.1 acyl-CoA dehydrogenase [Pseudarthrobacter sp. GA104]